MLSVGVLAESSLSLDKKSAKKYHVHIIPYTIIFGEEGKLDGVVSSEDIFAYTKKTGKLAKTSAINAIQYEDRFSEMLRYHPYLIHFAISGKISSTYEHAYQASLAFHGKVAVIDTESLSGGMALQAIYARELAEQGYSLDDIVEKIEERKKSMTCCFALEAVEYLHKGGRCSGVAALGANILHIRPQIVMRDGVMSPGKKFRGKKEKWVPDFIKATLEEFNTPDLKRAMIAYTDMDESILSMAEKMLKDRGFEEIIIHEAMGTVACHCGPGTLGIFYYNDGDR